VIAAYNAGTLLITNDNGTYWLTDDQSHIIWPEPFASQADAKNQVTQWLNEHTSGYQSLEGY
jgi:Leu/Phe-tRNA-protein transferase